MKTYRIDRWLLVLLWCGTATSCLHEATRLVVSVARGQYQVCRWGPLP